MEELGEFEFQEICKRKPECYCPPRYILNHELANIPEYLRRYFTELAKKSFLIQRPVHYREIDDALTEREEKRKQSLSKTKPSAQKEDWTKSIPQGIKVKSMNIKEVSSKSCPKCESVFTWKTAIGYFCNDCKHVWREKS